MRLHWLVLGLALGITAPATGQDLSQPLVPASPVLKLNTERVYQESLAGKAVEAQITTENEALAAENRKIDAALEAEERDLTERRSLLSVEDFQALAEAFNTKAVGLRDAQLSKAKALERKREEERQKFFQSLVPVLGEIMNEVGAYVILDDKAVLLSFGTIDITDEAVRRMDARGAAQAPGPAPTSP